MSPHGSTKRFWRTPLLGLCLAQAVAFAVPLAASAFCSKAPLPSDVWGLNLCRVRRKVTPDEYTCWSPTFGLFGQPKRFGQLIYR